MKSKIALYTIACILIIAAAISTALALTSPIRLACDIWPPYQMETRDGLTGFSTEVVKAVLKEMDVEIESIEPYPWKRALTFLEHGFKDGLFSANFTPERETFAIYPKEMIVESPWVIWSRGNDAITSLDDLKGKTVGVVIGYSYTDEFWDFIQTYCTVDKVTTDEINFKKLHNGRIFATVAEYGNGMYLANKLGFTDIRPQKQVVIKEDGLYMMFNRDNVSQGFVDDFSERLAKFKTTDAYKALYQRYFTIKTD